MIFKLTMYVAWYVSKQLLGVCSMICKQTITRGLYHDITGAYVNKQLDMIYKQTITGRM